MGPIYAILPGTGRGTICRMVEGAGGRRSVGGQPFYHAASRCCPLRTDRIKIYLERVLTIERKDIS
jgi:hypothetical protein